MASNIKHFLSLLAVELDDLKEDIVLLEGIQKERLKKFEITEYVYKENDAVFHSEHSAVISLISLLNQSDWSQHTSLETLIPNVKEEFEKNVKEGQFPPGILRFVSRKIEKVVEIMKP